MEENKTSPIAARSSVLRQIAKGLCLCFLAALFLCAGLLIFIRVGMSGDLLTKVAVPHIQSTLDKKISAKSVNLSWLSLGTARISIRGLEIRDRTGNQLLLRVPEALFEIDAISALKGTPTVNRAVISAPELFIPLSRAFLDKTLFPARQSPWPLLVRPVVRRFEVAHGRIYSATFDLKNSEAAALLSKIEIICTNASPYGVEGFSLQGVTAGTESEGSVKIDGHLTSNSLLGDAWQGNVRVRIGNLSVSPFRWLASYLNIDLPLLEGTLDMDAGIEGGATNFHARGNLSFSKVMVAAGHELLRNVLMDKGSLRFTASRQDKNFRLALTEVGLPGLTFGAEIRIKNLGSPDPHVEISVGNADLDLQKLFPLLPFKLMKKEDRERLTEAGLNGHIVVTAASWAGKTSDLIQGRIGWMKLFVDAHLDKVSGFVPGLGLRVKNATGRVRVSASEMAFKGISLTVGGSSIVINGWISDLQSSPQADLFLSMAAQGQDLRPILENESIVRYLEPWIGSVTDVQGGISVTMDMKGLLKRPKMKGRVALEDFQCRFSQFPLPVRKMNGSLRFRSSEVAFAGLKGSIGDTIADMSGRFSPDNVDITAELRVAPSDLKKLNMLPEEIHISGATPVSLTLKGRRPVTNFSARVDLRGNTVRMASIVKKNAGTPLELDASGFIDPEGTTVEQGYLILEGTRISARGKIDKEGKIAILANLPPKGVPTSALIPLADPVLELQSGGRIEGDAVIKIGGDKSRDLHVESNLLINYVSLHIPGFHKRTDGVTGSLRFRGRSLYGVLERAKVGSSEITGTISISDFDNPKVDISLEAPFVDTTDFTAPPGYVTNVTWGEWIRANPVVRFLARSRGGAHVKIAKGKTSARTFANFQATFEGAQGLIKVPHWQMGFADGILRGTALFDIRGNTRLPLSLELQGDNIKMERILTSDPDRMRIEGELVAEGRLEWKTNSKRENHGIYKTGKIEVRIQNGVIQRFETLSRIFSAINFGSLMRGRLPDIIAQGLPFQRLTWTMEVFDSKWKVTDLKLSSDAARIEGFGMYFGDQDKVDLKLDVSPLVGLDTLVSGLLGNLFTTNLKTLTFPLRVSGPTNSPDVRMESFENLRSAEH